MKSQLEGAFKETRWVSIMSCLLNVSLECSRVVLATRHTALTSALGYSELLMPRALHCKC